VNLKKLKSSEIDAAIYAMLLGDGSCDKGGGNFTAGSNFCYKMGHSVKQKEYLLWKKSIIDQIGSVKTRVYNYEKNNSIYLVTNARKYFTKLEKIFYLDRKKIVNKKILSKLNSLSLAIWFMDDGYISVNNSGSWYGELCTDQFSFEQVTLIQKWLNNKFNLPVGIRTLRYKNGKVAYRIKFNKENCKKLKNIIEPFVKDIKCMHYKINKVK
jgi:hypothetical protein